MDLSSLSSLVVRSKKRLGRGHGSGKVKTGGRGTKGQKARGKIKAGFEGGQLPLIKRLPLLRGRGRNKSRGTKPTIVQVDDLKLFSPGTVVTLAALKKIGLVASDVLAVRVIGNGKLSVKLEVQLPSSAGAKDVIEKAGGTVTLQAE